MSQVHDTPEGHVTRDYKEGVARLSDLRFKAVDTSGKHVLEHQPLVCSASHAVAAQQAWSQMLGQEQSKHGQRYSHKGCLITAPLPCFCLMPGKTPSLFLSRVPPFATITFHHCFQCCLAALHIHINRIHSWHVGFKDMHRLY